MSIDKQNRILAIKLLNQFIDRKIGKDDFESGYPMHSTDQGIRGVFYYVWRYYSDAFPFPQKFNKRILDDQEISVTIHRCILFFHSELEYQWSEKLMKPNLIGLLRLVGLKHVVENYYQPLMGQGDFGVWPFFKKEDYIAIKNVNGKPVVQVQ
jgi:hypothetical protein